MFYLKASRLWHCVYLHFSPVQVFKFYNSNVQKKILHLNCTVKFFFQERKLFCEWSCACFLTSYQTSISHFILLHVYIYSHKTLVLKNKFSTQFKIVINTLYWEKKIPIMCIHVLILHSELYLPGYFNI